ncbi:hypothetical protein J1605_010264 [Eschrichtius robustus]|uniref:Uncharacterized protein n=1 Tax=Eschrichtius robustus TaxID=9764 RepID=A0AB34GUG1_ESCRO|nr:hypothetical protein J1605_010264 [Eschrichtius robustus]
METHLALDRRRGRGRPDQLLSIKEDEFTGEAAAGQVSSSVAPFVICGAGAGRGRGRPDSATAAEAHIPKNGAPSRGGLGDLLRILGSLGPGARERWALDSRQRHNPCSLERACGLQTLWSCAGRP